jgi:hypothetical protein
VLAIRTATGLRVDGCVYFDPSTGRIDGLRYRLPGGASTTAIQVASYRAAHSAYGTPTILHDTLAGQAYDFVCFSAPIGSAPTINKVKRGRAVPVKCGLLSAIGSPVTNLTTATLRFTAGACTDAGGPTEDVEGDRAGNSGLQNLEGENYQMKWKTPSTATPCGELHLAVGDGVVHTARFQIT